jgi:hypothetical protein
MISFVDEVNDSSIKKDGRYTEQGIFMNRDDATEDCASSKNRMTGKIPIRFRTSVSFSKLLGLLVFRLLLFGYNCTHEVVASSLNHTQNRHVAAKSHRIRGSKGNINKQMNLHRDLPGDVAPQENTSSSDGGSLMARYIQLTRTSPSPDSSLPFLINILGIDVYDDHGTFISNQSTPYISQVLFDDTAQFGPKYLIDGVHQAYKPDGSYRLPHTAETPGAFMQLDFGKDVFLSSIVLWNLMECKTAGCDHRIMGCTMLVINSAGITVFSQPISTVDIVYNWTFGFQLTPIAQLLVYNVLTDGNIFSAAYQWVTDNAAAMATNGDYVKSLQYFR